MSWAPAHRRRRVHRGGRAPAGGHGARAGGQVGVAPRPPPRRAGPGRVGGAGPVRRRRRGSHRGRRRGPWAPLSRRRRLGDRRGLGRRRRGCTSRRGPSTWATRAPPCACWPGSWPADPAPPSSPATPRCRAGPWTGWRCPCGSWGRRSKGRASAACRRLRIRGGAAAGHRLHHAGGQRPGEVVRAAGRPRRRGRHGGARAGAHPAPHRGAAGSGAARISPRTRTRRRATWCGSARPRCHPSSSTCRGPLAGRVLGGGARAWCPGSDVTVERVYVGRGAPGLPRRARPHGGERSRRFPSPGPATWPPPRTSWPASGPYGTEVHALGDHRARRGPRAGRGGGVRRGRHGVPGRGGAAGEGVGPARRAWSTWCGRSAGRPRSTATTSWCAAPAAGPRRRGRPR